MPKGYWIANLTITDLDAYKQYAAMNGAAFQKYGAKFLVRGGASMPGVTSVGRSTLKSGETRPRHVVLEFDSYETALACYESPEYQAALVHRDKGSIADVIVIEGYEP